MRESIDCGQLVRHLLKAGHTTKSLGQAVGLSQPSISRISSGRTKNSSAETVVKLIQLAGGEVKLPDTLTTDARADA